MTTTATSLGLVHRLPLAKHRTWQQVDGLGGAGQHTQGALALTYPLPAGLEAEPRPSALVVVPHGAQATATAGSEAWAATFIQAVVEVIASDRPLTQLVRWTNRAVYADIAKRQKVVARHKGSTRLRPSRQQVATVRVSRPAPGCAEIAARITIGARSRAVAARLDYLQDRWLCTDIQFG